MTPATKGSDAMAHIPTIHAGRVEVSVGIAQETIAANATGRVLVAGYAALVNVPAAVTRGHYIETHTVAKQATGSATRRSGSFGQFGSSSATPSAWLWGQTDQAASGDHGGLTGLLDDDHTQYIKDSEFTASGDTLRGTGAGTFATIKNNIAATTAPTATSDSAAGYSVGSRWIDTTADKEYVCLDTTASAAVWTETTQAGGGGGSAPVPWNLTPHWGAFGTGSAPMVNANDCHFMPATLDAAATITGIRIYVNTSSGNISVALYDSTGTRVATSGAVACPAAGAVNVNFTAPYAAAAGRYRLALSCDNVTAVFIGVSSSLITGHHGLTRQASAHPAPASIGTTDTPPRTQNLIGVISGGTP